MLSTGCSTKEILLLEMLFLCPGKFIHHGSLYIHTKKISCCFTIVKSQFNEPGIYNLVSDNK